MTEEEVQALQTELDTTRAELEEVRAQNETLSQELEVKVTYSTELEQTVVERDTEITTLKQIVSDNEADKEALGVSIRNETQRSIDDLTDSYTQAVNAYKAVVVSANPTVPAELITGDTIDAVDQSLESAKSLVSTVRATIEAEIAAGKVPAGAPPRTPPDLSSLSPREKIQYAVGGNK